MEAAVAAGRGEHGAVGALVNNAGYSQSGALETLPMERLRAQFETNVFGLVRMCQLVLPGMRGAGSGRIRQPELDGRQARLSGRRRLPRHQVRGRGDLGRIGFEVRDFGIRVVIVEPGLITTNFGETAAGSLSEAAGDQPDRADDPYASFNAAVGAATVGLRGTDEAPRRPALTRSPR